MISNILATTSVRLLGAVAQVALLLVLTRLIGPRETGFFLIGYSILIILSTVCRLGTELSGMREVAAHINDETPNKILRIVRARKLITLSVSGLAVSIWMVCGLGWWWFSSHIQTMNLSVLIISAALPAVALLGLYSEVLKAINLSTVAVLIQNVALPTILVGTLSLLSILGRANSQSAAIATVVASWVCLLAAAVVWRKWIQRRNQHPDINDRVPLARSEILNILSETPSLLIVSSASIIMQWVGSIYLGVLAEPEDVAGFGIAMRLALAASVLNSAMISVMGPRMAHAHADQDHNELARLSRVTSVTITIATLPIFLLILLFPNFWLSLFGESFTLYAMHLRIIVLGQVCSSVIGHSGMVLVMTGYYVAARQTSLAAAGCLLLLMPVLTLLFGTIGAAFAMSSSVIVGHGLAVILVRRYLGFWPFPTRLKLDQFHRNS